MQWKDELFKLSNCYSINVFPDMSSLLSQVSASKHQTIPLMDLSSDGPLDKALNIQLLKNLSKNSAKYLSSSLLRVN